MKFDENDLRAKMNLLIREGLEDGAEEQKLERLGTLVDMAFDLGCSKGTGVALDWGAKLEGAVSPMNAVRLDYILSNAWASRFSERSDKSVWGWEQPEFQKQIFYFKRALYRKEFENYSAIERCQIFTNLGNCLSTIGRFVEAQHAWRQALEIIPKFGMALGNRGSGAGSYMRALYDPGHQHLFAHFARTQLLSALRPDALFYDGGANAARDHYLALLQEIDEIFGAPEKDLDDYLAAKNFSLGRSKAEREYRSWCISNRLFLNPLNDIIEHSIVARDVLSTPSITCSISQSGPPAVIGFFNQMKQEFVSARWSFYSGSTKWRAHFSDRGVVIPNTLDYASHCLAVEEVKNAFRAAYSIFDKIAYFINQYFELGIPDNKIWFRKIWYVPDKKQLIIREDLEKTENWALRGLFWLSKDFFDSAQDASDPRALELATVRNHLEHKFLRIHEFGLGDTFPSNDKEGLGFSITRSRFQDLTLHLLSLSRSALIYLTLAVENEERRRPRTGLTMPMFLPPIDDSGKI